MNRWAGLTGLLLGSAGAVLMMLLEPRAGRPVAAAVVAIAWTLLLGDLRQKPVWVALLIALARWLALFWLAAPAVCLLAVQTIPQSATVAFTYVTRPLEYRETASLHIGHVGLAIACAIVAAVPCGIRFGWFAVSCGVVVAAVFRSWAESSMGGARAGHRLWMARTAECVILTAAACDRCRW